MERSVLIVGHRAFCQMTKIYLEPLGDCSVAEAQTAAQATLALQAATPDLMIVQADDLAWAASCLQLRGRSAFQWVYSLLVVTTLEPGGKPEAAPPPAQAGETHPRALKIAAAEHQAKGLELGVDAYLALGTVWQGETLELSPAFQRLLTAQLQLAWTSTQRHRELLTTNDLLSTIALVDPLTELNNRRALDWDLPRQITRARDGDRPLGLMIFDLDFFKKINDTHGHLVGDVSLKLLSARLRHNLRANDTLFRYGGEEFVVLLSDTSPEEANEIAQRLCNMIGHQSFTINDDLELSLTVSVGVSELNDSDDAKGISLLERADYGLRQAKQMGRNRVVTC